MNGSIGSVISKGTPAEHYNQAAALTQEGIMKKHNLSAKEFEKMAKELKEYKLSDILFHSPDGPKYDITLHLIAYCR